MKRAGWLLSDLPSENMTVKLDLRPDRIDGAEALAAKRACLVCAASFCLFVLCVAVFIATAGSAFYRIANLEDLHDVNEMNEARAAAASAELKDLRAESLRAAEDVDFILSGAAVLEFLDGVAACQNDSMTVEYIEISLASALLKGVALSDRGVLLFADAVARLPAVEKVGIPAVTSAERCGAEIKIFSLDVKLRSVREVLLSVNAAVSAGSELTWKSAV